jgi:type I restriction enzyme S subunit
LRANNVNLETNSLDFYDLKYIKDSIQVSKDKRVSKGSIIICTASGSKSHLGKVALINDDYDYAFGGFMGLITPKKEIESNYLFYNLISYKYKKFIDELSDGVNINNLKFDDLKVFEIPLPPLPEQQRIVEILDEVFEGMGKAKENAEKNLQNARELFESYLQSVFANPGEGWEEKTLDQVSITFGRGKSKHRPRNEKTLYGGKYPFIQTGDIRNSNHYITEYSQTYSEIGFAQSKLWPKGTICITIAANIAETGILGFDACFPDSVIGLVVNPKIAEMNFVEYLLQSFKARLQEKGKGSAQDNLNMRTFENELFPIPPLPEQRSIVAKLDALSLETKKLEAIYQQKLADLDELKKSVLEKAFTGQLTMEN